MSAGAEEGEAVRQQALVAALSGPTPVAVAGLRTLCGPSRQAPAEAGLQAYRRNAMASARRALVAAYPTVQQLLGDEAMKALARDLWRAHPIERGDLAGFGAELPAWLGGLEAYAELPWLADVARLDWAVHRAGFAADACAEVLGLSHLAECDPQQLWITWQAGALWLESEWPVWQIYQAHRSTAPTAQAADTVLWAGRRECLWVLRRSLAVVVAPVRDEAQAAFSRRLWQGQSLGAALAAAPAGFSFEHWLVQALQWGLLAAVRLTPVA